VKVERRTGDGRREPCRRLRSRSVTGINSRKNIER